MAKRLTPIMVALLLLSMGQAWAIGNPVNIPDPNLEALLREKLNSLGVFPGDSITDTQLLLITNLTGPNRGIADLTGMEYCTNLLQLSLDSNLITDVTPLQGLTKLTILTLIGNQITDPSPLANLTNLVELSLDSNGFSSLSWITGLTKLTVLTLINNNITDPSPLASLTKLVTLSLDNNPLNNLNGLGSLTSLQVLTLISTGITDFSPIAGLTSLRELSIDSNGISDLSGISSLTGLTFLTALGNNISDLSPLQNLSNLSQLILSNNNISDIGPLSGLTDLMTLTLSNNNIAELQPLVDNPGITGFTDTVDVRNNPLSGVSVLQNIPTLEGRNVTVLYTPFTGDVTLEGQSGDTWSYRLSHVSGWIYSWEYQGQNITGASVDGAAAAAGWQVDTQTSTQVVFISMTPLQSASLTGFHITGSMGGLGNWNCGIGAGWVDGPLPITYGTFTAAETSDGILLEWQTLSEENNLGFHVYRSESRDGDYHRITSKLIPGQGTDANPHDYVFLDETARRGRVYWYRVEGVDFEGKTHWSDPISVMTGQNPLPSDDPFSRLAQEVGITGVPTRTQLLQNFPNPFNPETWFPFRLAADAEVTFRIFDATGQLVRQLELGRLSAGNYLDRTRAVHWDGRNDDGQQISSGVYFYQLRAGDFSATRKMIVLR